MLKGCNFIGFQESKVSDITYKAFNPLIEQYIEPNFTESTENEIKNAGNLAKTAFDTYKNTSPLEKADFLNTIAGNLEKNQEIIINRCMEETALPQQRLVGEMGRTVNQIKMFANLLKEGSYCNAKIDTEIPDRKPIPKPDIRQMLIPIGPVLVFGASNFPLAFSVAGGDTISALAAGCSVIVKAHPSHPGTSELVAKEIIKAIKEFNLPEGLFSLLHGVNNKVGENLVKLPEIKAVGFTGSKAGGKALFDLACKREEPIPVYAEMGSVNPIVIFQNALKEKGEEIVNGLVASVTLGVGQFCTNPGVIFTLKSRETDLFFEKIKGELKTIKPGTMLSDKIAKMYGEKIEEIKTNATLLASGESENRQTEGKCYIFHSNAEEFEKNKKLQQEVFGPSTIIIVAKNKKQLTSMLKKLEGQLTITFHGTESELKENSNLIEIAKEKAGRLIINGFPTGVEVCHSMHHGGPYPATTDSKFTSVGTESIKRFLKPICYQDFPDNLLPPQLQNQNPLKIQRQINGEYTKKEIGS